MWIRRWSWFWWWWPWCLSSSVWCCGYSVGKWTTVVIVLWSELKAQSIVRLFWRRMQTKEGIFVEARKTSWDISERKHQHCVKCKIWFCFKHNRAQAHYLVHNVTKFVLYICNRDELFIQSKWVRRDERGWLGVNRLVSFTDVMGQRVRTTKAVSPYVLFRFALTLKGPPLGSTCRGERRETLSKGAWISVRARRETFNRTCGQNEETTVFNREINI